MFNKVVKNDYGFYQLINIPDSKERIMHKELYSILSMMGCRREMNGFFMIGDKKDGRN